MPQPGCLPAVCSLGIREVTRERDELRHHHDFDEVCLVVGDCTIIHAGRPVRASAGDVFVFLAGEDHGYQRSPRSDPSATLWVVHFERDPWLTSVAPRLIDADPDRRIVHLNDQEREQFQSVFLRLMADNMRSLHDPMAPALSSAWLRIMLLSLMRWSHGASANPTPHVDPEVGRMWRWLADHVDEGPGLDRTLSQRLPNYRTHRRQFRATYGQSPSAVLLHLRLARGQYLLLDTDLSIHDIASQLGYARQHEFSRIFKRVIGQSPQHWRSKPMGRK